MKIHIDTDLGGNPDDLCALALVLAWPGAELVGVTTVGERSGQRAGYTHYALQLAGRENVPIVAGAAADVPMLPHERYWPAPVEPRPAQVEQALDLLARNIDDEAVIVALGPYTNLALLERRSPGSLERARLFLMGGYVSSPPANVPQYSWEQDRNVQADAGAARFVIENSDPVFVPLAVSAQTALCPRDLAPLGQAGPLARLIAHQAVVYAEDSRYEEEYGILLMLHDPLTCAIALDWEEGVQISRLSVRSELENGLLRQTLAADGRSTRMVAAVDAEAFNSFWLDMVTATP